MRVNNIQSTNFQSKRRYIPQKTNEELKQLLAKMNESSININDEKAHMLKSVSVDGDIVLYDNRTATNQPAKLALMDVGKQKNQLVIDTETGEIIDSHTSIFSSWRGIINSVIKSVDKIFNNFDNESVVKRQYLPVTNN